MFKERLKELREKAGLTQKELGEKIFVSRSAICKWEMGNGIPSDANLETLCEFFHVKEDWLLDRSDLKETVKIYKLQIKNIVISVIGIIIPFILCLISFIGIFAFGKYGEINISIYITPLPIVYYLGWWSLLPIFIWIVTIVFSILQISNNTLKNRALLTFKVNFGLLILSLLAFLVSFIISNSLANINNFWLIGFQ